MPSVIKKSILSSCLQNTNFVFPFRCILKEEHGVILLSLDVMIKLLLLLGKMKHKLKLSPLKILLIVV